MVLEGSVHCLLAECLWVCHEAVYHTANPEQNKIAWSLGGWETEARQRQKDQKPITIWVPRASEAYVWVWTFTRSSASDSVCAGYETSETWVLASTGPWYRSQGPSWYRWARRHGLWGLYGLVSLCFLAQLWHDHPPQVPTGQDRAVPVITPFSPWCAGPSCRPEPKKSLPPLQCFILGFCQNEYFAAIPFKRKAPGI